ncbi:MAG TPA: hypothetical protein VGJ44_01930 [Kribbellaceae bacterium]
MATIGGPRAGDVGLEDLLESSPEPRAHTSVAAEAALLTGLGALLTAPFSVLYSLSAGLAAVALLCGFVALVTTRRPDLAGSALGSFGLGFGLLALALLAVRFAGVDTAFGDSVVPWLADLLQRGNARLPQPR